MLRLIVHWILSAISLIVVSRIVPGFVVHGVQTALIAAIVIGFLNATLGFVLKVITLPLAILTFGIFLLIVNAAMILLASHLVVGFHVHGLSPAFWGAAVLAVLGMIVRVVVKE
jgi:putative membrane protein